MKRIAVGLLGLLGTITMLVAQQVGRNAQSTTHDEATFKATTQLVVEAIEVRDKQGSPIEGLSQSDFTLTENGVPQTIRSFEFHKLPPLAADRLPPSTAHKAQPDLLTRPPGVRVNSIGTEPPGAYHNKRLLVLYFDLTAMPVVDRLRAFSAAEKFVGTQMTSSDLVAMAQFSAGAVRILSEFSADRESLLAILQSLSAREVQGFEEATNEVELGDTGAAFGQNDAEFNVFRTDRQLAGLQTMTRMLGRINEKKALVYFGSGLQLNGMDNQAQLTATVNDAVRAGLSLWPVDSRGLTAEAPLGDASKASPSGTGIYTGAAALAVSTSLQRSQDNLWTLAADTGGKALLDSNDLAAGIVAAQKATSSYYILGYYTTNDIADGKLREIKVSVKGNSQAALNYRRGYFAQRRFEKLAPSDRERQLEDALLAGDPITEITMAVEVDYFRINRAEYLVPVALKMPGRDFTLSKQRSADRARIDFIGEVKDQYGTTVQNVRDKMDLKLDSSVAAALPQQPIEYQTSFTLLPGSYRLKLLARDLESGRIGTYESAFAIPDLAQDEIRLPISALVIRSQAEGTRLGLRKSIKNKPDDRLSQTRLLLIPSVTRVFHRGTILSLYFEAYSGLDREHSGVHAFAALYRGATKVLESSILSAAVERYGTIGIAQFEINLPLTELTAGEYRCQVTVVDEAKQKATFWNAPILLVP